MLEETLGNLSPNAGRSIETTKNLEKSLERSAKELNLSIKDYLIREIGIEPPNYGIITSSIGMADGESVWSATIGKPPELE